MKEGFYIRYVPVISEWTFYYFYNNELFILTGSDGLCHHTTSQVIKTGLKR